MESGGYRLDILPALKDRAFRAKQVKMLKNEMVYWI
jgi:hypothetical protein